MEDLMINKLKKNMIQEKFSKYVVSPGIDIITALKQINSNHEGFLVIVDKKNRVIGTITDGDIRRYLIKEGSIEGTIQKIYIKNCRTVLISDGLSMIINQFKNEGIDFLPIVDETGHLLNLITKKQIYTLLLQDVKVDLSFDFMGVDSSVLDYEIFPKPWGFYKTTVMNQYSQSKVVCVYPNSQLSLQSHKRREEYWIIVHGRGKVQIEDSVINARRGDSFFIPKGSRHRLTNLSIDENLIVTEIQIGDYFGEDDIIRYEDTYGRT